MSDNGVFLITQFELDELVFVPAGDGERAQRKRFGSLTREETARYERGQDEAHARFEARYARRDALVAKRRAGLVPLSHAEAEELFHLEDEQLGWAAANDKRKAAIAADRAAGRFFRMGDD